MKKILALSVLASAILTGCGGGGGPGTSPRIVAKYAFQFVQLEEQTEGATQPDGTSCTIFNVAGETAGQETYAKLAADVTVHTFDKNGDFVKDLSDSVSDSGVLNFTEDDLVDEGYISIIDSARTRNYHDVLSIQKALLTDMIIKVNRGQGDVSCYQAGQSGVPRPGYATVKQAGIKVSTYAFNSSQSDLAAAAFTSKEVRAFAGEKVLVRGYQGNDLAAYAFVSTLTPSEDGSPTALSEVAQSQAWSILLDPNELDALSVRINKGNYSYPWVDAIFDIETGDTTDFPYTNREASWSYRATGTTTSNWDFTQNGTLQAILDVQLPLALTLTDIAPSVADKGSYFVFKAEGIDASSPRLQRSQYEVYFDRSNSLNHVIYSQVAATGDEVFIPKLLLDNLDPTDVENIENINISVLSADDVTDKLIKFFFYETASKDLVSAVMTPAEEVLNNKERYMGNYTLLKR